MTEEQNFNDPKIQLTLSIKQEDEEIDYYMKHNRFTEAAKTLHYLLGRIEITDKPEDQTIKEIHDKLTLQNIPQLSVEDLDFAFSELHKFLNRTYYKGFSNNRPITRKSDIAAIGAKLNDRT